MRWGRSAVVLVLLLFSGLLAIAAPADIVNGTIDAGLTDWSIQDPFFPANNTNTAVVGGVAELSEDFTCRAPSQPSFALSKLPLTLSSDFDSSAVPKGTCSFSNDTIDLALYRPDPSHPLLPDLKESPLFGGGFSVTPKDGTKLIHFTGALNEQEPCEEYAA